MEFAALAGESVNLRCKSHTTKAARGCSGVGLVLGQLAQDLHLMLRGQSQTESRSLRPESLEPAQQARRPIL